MDRSDISCKVDQVAGDLDQITNTFNALLNGLDHELRTCVDAGISAASASDFTKNYIDGLSFVLCHFRAIEADLETLSEEIFPSKEVKETHG